VQTGKESSDAGRCERRDLEEHGSKPRAHAEAQHGDVREPRTTLPAVRVELLESVVQARRETGCGALGIGEHEHADRAGLPVPERRELDGTGAPCLPAKELEDALEPALRLPPEERERGVERIRYSPADRELLASPAPKRGVGLTGKLECEEEAEPSIRIDGSGFAHPGV